MQLDALWNYMQFDMEADRFENGMRKSPNRLKLLKQRDFLLEQQNNMKKVESNVAVMSDRLAAMQDEANRLQGVLNKLVDDLLAKINAVRFHRPVRPGDTMTTVVQNVKVRSKLGVFALKGYVGEELAVEAETTCVLGTMDNMK